MSQQVVETSQVALLNEIFLAPANDMIADRFSSGKQADAAPCNGSCSSGMCRAIAY